MCMHGDGNSALTVSGNASYSSMARGIGFHEVFYLELIEIGKTPRHFVPSRNMSVDCATKNLANKPFDFKLLVHPSTIWIISSNVSRIITKVSQENL